jgi:transposase
MEKKQGAQMRATTIFRRLLGIASTLVTGYSFAAEALHLWVKPSWHRPRCSGCHRKAKKLDDLTQDRSWRHLPWGKTRVVLHYDVRRVRCKRCGDVVELLPWSAEPRDKFSAPMCDLIGHLAQNMPHNRVSELLGISWETVGRVARRVAERLLPEDRLDNLKRIAVDEFYWGDKKYLTVVWDHDRSRVVWTGEGKAEESLVPFFNQLGSERCAAIEVVTGDMSAAYINAVEHNLTNAKFVLDHFHVLKLAHKALDTVRRQIAQELRVEGDTEQAKAIKNSRYVLLSDSEDLSPQAISKIDSVQQAAPRLFRAWSMKEALAFILHSSSVETAEPDLKRIIKWMKLSRLQPFIRLGHTLREHLSQILNSIRYQLSNGPLEGCNRKIRGLIYRAFGYRSIDNFLAAIYLNCGGIQVPNPMATC